MVMTDFIQPLEINGLRGRMLYMPAPKNKHRNILLLYGHHASLERMYGIAEDLNQYGAVTMPDWPGFGGMDSFFKLGMKPTLDNLADYLAAFIKLRFKGKKVTIGAMSFGFVVTTRMLQKYPHLIKKVDVLISIVGFCHHDDIKFTRSRFLFYRYAASFFSHRLPAAFFKNVVLHPSILRLAYSHMHNAKNKFKNLSLTEKARAMDFEIYLWRCNEVRTYMSTTISMLTLDNCQKRIDLPVQHVSVGADQFFDHSIVEQHMRVIFTNFTDNVATLDTHAPSIIADKEAASGMFPKALRALLARSPA